MTSNVVQPNLPPLPRAVQQRLERIERFRAEHPREPKTPASGQEPSAPPSAAAGDVPPASVTDPSAQPSAVAPTPAAAAAAPASPSPTAPAADPRENDPTYWRQRFKVTEGMLRTAQERHASELQRRDDEITQLRTQVRELEANRAPSKIDLAAFFSPEQIERFGEDQCEAMARAAMKAAGDQAQKLIETEVQPIRDRSKAEATRAENEKEAAFWEALAAAVPNYQEINARDDWLAWLMEDDASTGLPRQTILDQHRARRNAAGVAKVFADFELTLKRPTPPVAPPRAGASGDVAASQPQMPAKGAPTRTEIREFYKRSSLGKVTDQERQEFEARLRAKAVA